MEELRKCVLDALEIVENPLLTQIHLENINQINGVVVVKDNPQLDMLKYCQMFDKLLLGNRVILRNKVDCGEWKNHFFRFSRKP